MVIIDRLRVWSDIQKVRASFESPDVEGGRDGELLLKQLVASSFTFKDAIVLSGRRIPSKRQGRRREIDLVVCTPQMIHLIEVKNWSGRLTIQDGMWRQSRRGGQVVDHGDLLRENLLRRDAVVDYLKDRGVDLDEAHLSPRVIFTNPNLELAPEVEAREDVISRRELDGYLGQQKQQGLVARAFASVIEYCLDTEAKVPGRAGRIPHAQYERAVACLSEAATWDQLHYYGGKVITGDLLSWRIGTRTYRRLELVEISGKSPIRLKWTRGRLWGLMKVLSGLGNLGVLYLGKDRLVISPDDTVLFHAVGEPESRSRKMVELESIVLG